MRWHSFAELTYIALVQVYGTKAPVEHHPNTSLLAPNYLEACRRV